MPEKPEKPGKPEKPFENQNSVPPSLQTHSKDEILLIAKGRVWEQPLPY